MFRFVKFSSSKNKTILTKSHRDTYGSCPQALSLFHVRTNHTHTPDPNRYNGEPTPNIPNPIE